MKKTLLVLLATGWFLCGFAQEIQFETVEHDFGLVKYNDPAVFDFVFTNTGTEPLIVQKPKSSCGCTLPSWPKDPIMPGQKNKVSVTYRTNRVGKINKTVTITSNAKNSPSIVLRITGEVLGGGSGARVVYKNDHYGLESKEGEIVIPVEYDMIKINGYGYFQLEKSGKHGLADETGHIIVPSEYEMINQIHNDQIQLRKNRKWGIADETGHIFIPCEYDEKIDLDESGWVKKGGRWGIINKENRVIIPFDYEDVNTLKNNRGGIVKKGGKWGKINVENNKIIIPFEYEMLSESIGFGGFDGNVYAKKNGKFGMLNASGKTIILPFEYNTIEEVVDAYLKKTIQE